MGFVSWDAGILQKENPRVRGVGLPSKHDDPSSKDFNGLAATWTSFLTARPPRIRLEWDRRDGISIREPRGSSVDEKVFRTSVMEIAGILEVQ